MAGSEQQPQPVRIAKVPYWFPKVYRDNPRTLIAHSWFLGILFGIFFILFGGMTINDGNFGIAWMCILLLAYFVAGTALMRQGPWHPFNVGIFLGATFMFVLILLPMFVLLSSEDYGNASSSVFCFILLFHFFCMFIIMMVHRRELYNRDIIQEEENSGEGKGTRK